MQTNTKQIIYINILFFVYVICQWLLDFWAFNRAPTENGFFSVTNTLLASHIVWYIGIFIAFLMWILLIIEVNEK